MSKKRQFKRGAAAFYIVAISTLILVVIAASFAAVIISEVNRSTNDDLAQSAYDSALAGIEDAKLTLINYQKCKEGGTNSMTSGLTCDALINWIENGTVLNGYDDCDMVAAALGRPVVEQTGADGTTQKLGVLVQEQEDNSNPNSNTNAMQQYYTCVKINTRTEDVLGMLNANDPNYSVRVQFVGGEATIQKVAKVRLSWHSTVEDGDSRGFKFMDALQRSSLTGGVFGVDHVMPAVVSLGMVQTSKEFRMSDFDMSLGGQTNRGTVYFVPFNKADGVPGDINGKAISLYDYSLERNNLGTEGLLNSNSKGEAGANLPYLVACDDTQDYACSVDVAVPQPINGARNNDTFIFAVTLPYGGPSTHFSLEFFDADGNQLILDGVQTRIDSTGRANDLFRRVDTRLEPADAAYPFPVYGIQALDDDNQNAILKDFYTICEYGVEPSDPDRTCW